MIPENSRAGDPNHVSSGDEGSEPPAARTTPHRLGSYLVAAGLLSPADLATAIAISQREQKKLGEALVEAHLIAPETLLQALSKLLRLPVVDLQQRQPTPEALRLVPEVLARRYTLLPLELQDRTLVVAMEDPQDLNAVEALRTATRRRIQPVLALAQTIRAAIDLHYRNLAEIEQQVRQVTAQVEGATLPQARVTAEVVAQAPIVRTLELLITQAVRDRASDIHIEPQRDHLRIRYRIDGILHEVMRLPLAIHGPLVTRIKVLADMNIAERRRPQDGQFSTTVEGREVDVRVTTTETMTGEMAALRLLDKRLSFLQLSELGFRPQMLALFADLLRSPYGLILVAGPTGAGKTTTLYAAINQLNRHERNIMTIEDPVEFRFDGINQIQVNPQADITFATGLRAILRLDPDVILVGEVRDTETAQMAIHAALTGHLVLTSIHANDAAGALLRLIDLKVEPFLLTTAAIAVVAQRLVRRVCPHCRVRRPATPEEAAAYQEEMNGQPGGEGQPMFWGGTGCPFCANTGYLGRMGVYELLTVSDTIRQLLLLRASAGEIRAQALREGLVTLRRDGMLKVREGLTTPGEVLRNVFVIGG